MFHLNWYPIVLLLRNSFDDYSFDQIIRITVGIPVKIDRRFIQISGISVPIPPSQVAKTRTFKSQFNSPLPYNLFKKQLVTGRKLWIDLRQECPISYHIYGLLCRHMIVARIRGG